MESVPSVTTAGTAATACAGGMALEGFLAKADGDTALEALIFQNAEAQARLGKQGVAAHGRRVLEAREQRMRALERMQEASQKSGFWGKLGKVLGPLFGAVAVALKVFGLASAATGVGLVGAAICGAMLLAKAHYDARATRAKADGVEKQALAESEKLQQDNCRDFLEQAVAIERNMVRHLTKACEMRYRAPAYLGGEES